MTKAIVLTKTNTDIFGTLRVPKSYKSLGNRYYLIDGKVFFRVNYPWGMDIYLNGKRAKVKLYYDLASKADLKRHYPHLLKFVTYNVNKISVASL